MAQLNSFAHSKPGGILMHSACLYSLNKHFRHGYQGEGVQHLFTGVLHFQNTDV